jgi:threonine synthase
MFNLIQQRQIRCGAKLTISYSSFIKESQILNNILYANFKNVIENPTLAFKKLGIGNLARQLKATSRNVIASKST